MKMPGSSSPMRLACWAVIGSVVMIGSILMVLLPTSQLLDHSVWKNLLRFIVSLVPFGFGLAISSLAEKQLRQGIENDLWREEELQPLRRWLGHPALMAALFVPPVVWLGYVISADSFRGSSLLWGLIFPTQSVSRLKTIVMPPRVEGLMFQDGGDFKPIRSEHWGASR
jgi:hypothetical protein